ncbi:transcriptional regulator ovo isoform X1 [Bactrocera neohumeralis]|uniref:transcriptional regulator ovo isoform X1 n=1 Tax=Bactrocera neohumeralis TaxID=98809 RepID=UPI0021669370|nr:transcriptional regulator ovo isoform X1 [Bactrocera neohumeralis]
MPKIFLIKNRLHQQQQRLLESQNLLQDKNEDDRLVPPLSPSPPVGNGKPNTPPGATRSYTPPARHQLGLHSGYRAHTTPSPPALVPAPVQPPKTPEPLGKAEAATALLVDKRSTSPTTATATTVSTVIEDVQTANVASEEPVNLLVKSSTATTETAETTAPNTPPLSRKRFHHRRYYFGQQQLQLQQQQEKKLHNVDNDADAAEVGGTAITQNDRLSPAVPALAAEATATETTTSPLPHSSITSPQPQSPPHKTPSPCSPLGQDSFGKETEDCKKDSQADSYIQTPKTEKIQNSVETAKQTEEIVHTDKPRFYSSILGGNKPYSGVVLTQAQRKEYPVEEVSRRLTATPIEDSSSDSDSDAEGSKLIVDEKPLVPEDKPLSLRLRSTPPPLEKRPSPPPPPEPAVRCSVIQRTPKPAPTPPHRPNQHEVLLPPGSLEHLGPEQQEPIDYHVPKRRSASIDSDEEQTDSLNTKRLERERKLREARRRSAILAARAVLAQARLNPRLVRNLPGILAAAAGHGRTSSTGAGQGFQGSSGFGGNNSGSGNNQSPSGGAGSPTGFGGALGGNGGAGGGMGGGRDGRSNYGPNSPPSGALPPFYESLKSGNTMNSSSSSSANFNGNSNFLIQNAAAAAYLMSAAGGNGGGQQHSNSYLDCSSTNGNSAGGVGSGVNDSGSGGLEITTFANGQAYGIILKDEPDIEYDEAKIDIGAFAQNIIQATMGNSGNFNAAAYEDAIMSDLANSQGPNGSVDPLQFTATLMLSSQTDHLLEQLSDAVDLSSFLQRECVDDDNSTSPRQDFELVSTPSLTPDSVSITPVDTNNGGNLDTFHESLIQQITNNISRNHIGSNQNGNMQSYPFERQQHLNGNQQHLSNEQHNNVNHQQQQPPPSYQHATRDLLQMQQQQQQHHAQTHSYHQQQQHHSNSMLQHGGPMLLAQQPQQHAYQQHGHPYGPAQHHHQQPHHIVPPHHMQHHHHHSSDNSNLSLPSPNAAHLSAHHGMSSAASNSSGASTSGLLDASTAMLDTKPLIQSVSPTHSTGSSNASSCAMGTRKLSTSSSCASATMVAPASLRSVAAAAAATAAGILPPSPTVAMLHESKVLQQRLGLPPEVQLEFVNGGHGIKNPLAVENTHSGHHRIRSIDCVDDLKKSGNISTDGSESGGGCAGDGSKFVCRICLKSFSLQRLLNRHMKCHSEIKRYLCTFCGKGFNDTFDLKRHTRTHTGVRPYKCNLCEKSFTQRCSLESHCLKVHSVQHQYAYKERRAKMYVCEECGHTTCEPEVHYIHLKENHPYSPALLKFYDKRHFKFTNSQFANNLLGQLPMPVHN